MLTDQWVLERKENLPDSNSREWDYPKPGEEAASANKFSSTLFHLPSSPLKSNLVLPGPGSMSDPFRLK